MPKDEVTHPLESEIRLGLLRSAQADLPHPPSMESLDRWAARIEVRSRFLTDTAWGTIRWKKTIGRSLGPTLSSGFRGENYFLEIDGADLGGGVPLNLSKWKRADADPLFWDMPDDGDQFQVGYMFWMKRPWYQAVNLYFSALAWDSPLVARVRANYRAVVSPEPFWVPSEIDHAVLAPTPVVELPIRVFGP